MLIKIIDKASNLKLCKMPLLYIKVPPKFLLKNCLEIPKLRFGISQF